MIQHLREDSPLRWEKNYFAFSVSRSWFLSFLVLFVVSGCGSNPRFVDSPVVWQVDDKQDIQEPKERKFNAKAYFATVLSVRSWTRALELRDRDSAKNINALDEVPDSTWFQNRIGARDVSPEEAAQGPVKLGPPRLPLTVTRGKDTGGGNPGFFVNDSTGRTFLIKFDPHENPEMQTATGVIVNRAFWTLGYNVPEDTVFEFSRSDLQLQEGAKTSDPLGRKIPMTEQHVDAVLSTAPRTVAGRYRASASLFLEGIPKGGVKLEGLRKDDPNDQIPHEKRRELRALRVFCSWLGHTDMKEDNTLDMYVEEDGRHFLRHYLLDFGEALGAHQAEKGRMEDGYESVVDYQKNGSSLLTLGIRTRPWEYQEQTPWPAIGAFSDEWFVPKQWREAYPYWPIREADAADLYWGAKLVMRFSRPMLEAIVAEGQFSNPEAAAFLVNALLGRRDKIGRAWLEALTPFDYLRIHDKEICGFDLGIYHHLAQEGTLVRLNEKGMSIDEYRVGPTGRVCLPIDDDETYRIMRLSIRRNSELKPMMQVHYKGGAKARILGIIRNEP